MYSTLYFRFNILYTNINTNSECEGASSEMMIQMVSVGEK